jgi:hypothetical protein
VWAVYSSALGSTWAYVSIMNPTLRCPMLENPTNRIVWRLPMVSSTPMSSSTFPPGVGIYGRPNQLRPQVSLLSAINTPCLDRGIPGSLDPRRRAALFGTADAKSPRTASGNGFGSSGLRILVCCPHTIRWAHDPDDDQPVEDQGLETSMHSSEGWQPRDGWFLGTGLARGGM